MEVSAEQIPQPEVADVAKEDEKVPDQQSPSPQPGGTNGGTVSEQKHSAEEVRGGLKLIASTGKFWNDWDDLMGMLSFQLKQVLSEYPEATMADDQVCSSLGETYQDLVKRLDEAIHSFPEGPPFTLQRLCEILLDARDIYPVLSKLALALEKNLLVTTTLSKCTDPHPLYAEEQKADAPKEEEEGTKPSTNPVENGMEPPVENQDKDEVMTEVEEADEARDDMTVDTETPGPSENVPEPDREPNP